VNATIPAPVSLPLLLFGALACFVAATSTQRQKRLRALVPSGGAGAVSDHASGRRSFPLGLDGPTRVLVVGLSLAGVVGFLGSRLAGPPGLGLGSVGGFLVPRWIERRRGHRRAELFERQLGELVEATALAVRAGLSVSQAIEFAAGDASEPMASELARMQAEQRLGVPFEEALESFGKSLFSDDARLFVLVVVIHAKSGGDLAGALEEVTETIRHRTAVRRELRALSAQGRISGGILGVLPLFFFVVLAATSRGELGPVERSPAGVAMIGGGLLMQGLAYLWIRRLLTVEA
jgi:tight adherence protein B